MKKQKLFGISHRVGSLPTWQSVLTGEGHHHMITVLLAKKLGRDYVRQINQ